MQSGMSPHCALSRSTVYRLQRTLQQTDMTDDHESRQNWTDTAEWHGDVSF